MVQIIMYMNSKQRNDHQRLIIATQRQSNQSSPLSNNKFQNVIGHLDVMFGYVLLISDFCWHSSSNFRSKRTFEKFLFDV